MYVDYRYCVFHFLALILRVTKLNPMQLYAVKRNPESKEHGTCFHSNYPKTSFIELITSCLTYCSCVTYLLTVPPSLLLAVNIFNIFSCTYVQLTIVVITWHDLTLYSIVYTYVSSYSGFPTLAYMFRCRLFLLFLEQNLSVVIFKTCCIRHPMTLVIIYWVLKLFVCG